MGSCCCCQHLCCRHGLQMIATRACNNTIFQHLVNLMVHFSVGGSLHRCFCHSPSYVYLSGLVYQVLSHERGGARRIFLHSIQGACGAVSYRNFYIFTGFVPGLISLLLLHFTSYPKRPLLYINFYPASRCRFKLRGIF
jgi:hypothetical protein